MSDLNQTRTRKSKDCKNKRSKRLDVTDKGSPTDLRNIGSGQGQTPNQIERQRSNDIENLDTIILRVGKESIGVEKNKLAASSEYFRALFSGNFSDSDLKELDLSKDTNRIEDLKIVLDYIQCGQHNITEGNVSQILKLSSFFVVEGLTAQCAEFILETSTPTNCLQYFILSAEYALPKYCSRKAELFLETRFHDLIVNKTDTSFYLDEHDLRKLLDSNIMKYCSKESILNFVLLWLSKCPELIDVHYSLVADIFQYFNLCDTAQTVPLQSCKKKMLSNIDNVLGSHIKCDPQLLQQFRQLCFDFLRGKCQATWNDIQTDDGTCLALFTFSERTSLKKGTKEGKSIALKTGSSLGTASSPKHVFDLCVYQPFSRVWYHIASFAEDKYFGMVDGRDFKPTAGFCGSSGDIYCEIMVINTEIWFCDVSNKFKLVKYNICNGNWTTLNVSNLVDSPVSHFRFEFSRNDVAYLITMVELSYLSEIVFHGYIVDLSNMKCKRIFTTQTLQSLRHPVSTRWSHMTVKLSSVSNEILILYTGSDGENSVFIVDLDPQKNDAVVSTHCLLHKVARSGEFNFLFSDVEVIETEDKFLVVSTKDEILKIKFVYKFGSKIFDTVNYDEMYRLRPVIDRRGDKSNRSHFGNSFWILDTEEEFASFCKKISVRFGNFILEHHTPPPFVDVISVFATEVKRCLFRRLEPIRHFLERKY